MKISVAEKILHFGTRQIVYRLHRANRKRLRIVVSPELSIDVYAPSDAEEDRIVEALRKKSPWITRTLDKMAAYHPLPSPTRYTDGETIVYLGRQYRLKVESGLSQPAKLIGRYLQVHVRDKMNAQAVKGAVESWYRQRGHEIFKRYLMKCLEVVSRHGVVEPVFAVRTMKRRWGSCSPKGRITLNSKLVQVPVHCIEYVLMHELCHLRYHNHSKLFYALLGRCMPDWKVRRDYLNTFSIN